MSRTLPLVVPQTDFERSVQAAFQQLQVPDAGSTAQRPTTGLYPGQRFWDTSLGRPIWWRGDAWVDANTNVV